MNTLNQTELAGIVGGTGPVASWPVQEPQINTRAFELLWQQLTNQQAQQEQQAWLEFMRSQAA